MPSKNSNPENARSTFPQKEAEIFGQFPQKVSQTLDGVDKSANKSILQVEEDITTIHHLVEGHIEKLSTLKKGIDEDGPERLLLDGFLMAVGLEINQKTRYVAYRRIYDMNEGGIKNYLETSDFSREKKNEILMKAYDFVAQYHTNIHSELLGKIYSQKLLTPFYRQILTGTHRVGCAFNEFNQAWDNYLIFGVNQRLEERFSGDQEAIMKFLTENDLFDKGHGGEQADRSYSVLRETEGGYMKLSYFEAFPKEVGAIILELDTFARELEGMTDNVYGQRDAYIIYLNALIDGFSEKSTDLLVEKWAQVDVAWMAIQSPFQIGHPLEYYEDPYRKAVSPEWDLRLSNPNLFHSTIRNDMVSVFEKIAKEKGIAQDSEIYNFTLQSVHNAQLYIAAPILYYGSQMSGLPYAQVVPNDAVVSKSHGKKIFSYAEKGLMQTRSRPKMKLARLTLEDSFYKKSEELLHGPAERYYAVYDVSTTGHEFGHTLWLDSDTEMRMNGTGNFKNVEEWKATTGGLLAFFQNPNVEIQEYVIVDLVERAVRLMVRMKIDDLVPYYCEGLIHLKLLFDSGMISLNSDGKVQLNFNAQTLEVFKKIYTEHYNNLVDIYISKQDSSVFLSQFAVAEGKYYLPKDPTLRAFVEGYYELYKLHGNTVDDTKEGA